MWLLETMEAASLENGHMGSERERERETIQLAINIEPNWGRKVNKRYEGLSLKLCVGGVLYSRVQIDLQFQMRVIWV